MPTRTVPADCPGCGVPLRVGYADAKAARTPASAWAVFLLAVAVSLAGVMLLFPLVMFAWKPVFDQWNVDWKNAGAVLSVTYIALLPLAVWPGRRGWRYLSARFQTATVRCDNCGWSGPVRVVADEPDGRGTVLSNARRKMLAQKRRPDGDEPPNPELDFGPGGSQPGDHIGDR